MKVEASFIITIMVICIIITFIILLLFIAVVQATSYKLTLSIFGV